MADTILKAEHLTKTFISGKKTLKAVDDAYTSGKYYRWKSDSERKRYYQYKRKRTSGNLQGYSDGISDANGIL